ncbi:MAG: rod shape-determining protein MreD [Planctomycetota bacterium]|nr:rod shape-determining protein MreD [Planctomycetota bacterium]
MSAVALFALTLLATALPDLLPSTWGLARHPPDLWALAALYLALRARGFRAVGWAVLLGLIRDCVSLDPLGTHGFVLGAIAFLFCAGQRERGRVDGASRVALVFVGVLASGWLYLLRLVPIGGGVVTFGAFLDAIPVALWSALLAMGLFPLFDRFGLFDDVCGRSRAFST